MKFYYFRNYPDMAADIPSRVEELFRHQGKMSGHEFELKHRNPIC
jgi:hypothetical protein